LFFPGVGSSQSKNHSGVKPPHSKKPKKESGVEPPHSKKAASSRRTPKS
jgi:hypothetical protein